MALSKRLCLLCPIFPLCLMLCIGKPQVEVKKFFLSTMFRSLVLQIWLLKNYSLLKDLLDRTIPPYPKGETCYLFFLIFALLGFSEKKKKVLSGFYLIDVMSYARTLNFWILIQLTALGPKRWYIQTQAIPKPWNSGLHKFKACLSSLIKPCFSLFLILIVPWLS